MEVLLFNLSLIAFTAEEFSPKADRLGALFAFAPPSP